MKIQRKPPLSFRGNKTHWFNEFKDLITSIKQPENYVFVDVFGGSGLLSYWIKSIHPNATVIYNDFDNFIDRVKHIDETEQIRTDLLKIISEVEPQSVKKKKSIISLETTEKIKSYLTQLSDDFVDWLTVSSWFCYHSKRYNDKTELMNYKQFYFKIPKKPINSNNAKGFHDGLIITHIDASEPCKFIEELQHQELIKDLNNVVFVLDPPYLYTDKMGYSTEYFKLESSVNMFYYLINKLKLILFTSEKSALIETYNTINKIYNIDDKINSDEIINKQAPSGGPNIFYNEMMMKRNL